VAGPDFVEAFLARRHFESSENAARLLRIYGELRRTRRGAEPSVLPRSAP